MAGFIKVITGEMFSGKSQELARLIKQSLSQGFEVHVFYPAGASRGSERDIECRLPESHPQLFVDAVPNANAAWLKQKLKASTAVVAVDEGQFFSDDIVEVVQELRRQGKMVLIGGLDQDYLEHPFGRMGDLMCIANDVEKFHAFCAHCQREDAFISHRVTDEVGQVVVGEHNYVPLCEDCYQSARRPQEVQVFVD
ncbi:MAG: thymidine kinase [Firmicutes bacterium]|nr:thymidine kinase [Bacillota bacterium]